MFNLSDIIFFKFCYMYYSKNHEECLSILKNEKNILLNIFPNFFIDVIDIKINNKDLNISIIEDYVNSEYKEELKYCFSFIVAEYVYKFLNTNDTLYDELITFCLSSDCYKLVKEYMLDWSTEESLERKIGMLDEIFEEFTKDFHDYLKEAARLVKDKGFNINNG